MRIFIGSVSEGFGVATQNLMPVEQFIEERMGLQPLLSGTLNLRLPEEYIVRADARIRPEEYRSREGVKLQRCLLRDPGGRLHQAIITRPESHEVNNQNHGTAHLEVMGIIHFQRTWNLHLGSEVEVQVEGDEAWWRSGIRQQS
jgi:CTP-dependent riboflavin kinase